MRYSNDTRTTTPLSQIICGAAIEIVKQVVKQALASNNSIHA
jgi:hypothetical protein